MACEVNMRLCDAAWAEKYTDTTEGALNAMDAGICKHGVLSYDMFKYALSKAPKHCNKAGETTSMAIHTSTFV